MLEVCIVGLGALGVLYGFLIEKSGKARVTAVCRSNYNVMKGCGVTIISEKYGTFNWKPSRVVGSVTDAADRDYDLVVCVAKFIPDHIPTSHILGPLLSRTSTIALIQNGIGVHEELRNSVPNATIISAGTWVDATTLDGGKVVKHGRIDRLVLGIHWPATEVDDATKMASQGSLNMLVDLLKTSGCDAIPTEDVDAARWQKNILNLGYSVFCTLSRASMATVLNDKWVATTTPILLGLMEEALSIARATGIPLPDSVITYAQNVTFMKYAETYSPRKETNFTPVHFKPSMLVDLEAGRPMEVEGIIGGVVRKGRDAGVNIPRLEMAYASLSLLQEPLLHAARNKASTSK